VVVEGVAFQGEEHKVAPPVVVGGEGLEDDRHQGADVLDGGSLGVEVGDGGSLEEGVRIAVDAGAASVGILLGVGRRLKALACGGGHTICFSRSLALALESVERSLHARARACALQRPPGRQL